MVITFIWKLIFEYFAHNVSLEVIKITDYLPKLFAHNGSSDIKLFNHNIFLIVFLRKRSTSVVISGFFDHIIIQVRCHTVIFATGATAKRLRLPREEEFWSRGISACAICDGASPIFKGQVLAVIGGGDTATEEALYLTKYARHVHLLVRRDQLRASRAMQDRCVRFTFSNSLLDS